MFHHSAALRKKMTLRYSIQSLNTRSKPSNFHISGYRTAPIKKSFVIIDTLFWNSLPNPIGKSSSLTIFKHRLIYLTTFSTKRNRQKKISETKSVFYFILFSSFSFFHFYVINSIIPMLILYYHIPSLKDSFNDMVKNPYKYRFLLSSQA